MKQTKKQEQKFRFEALVDAVKESTERIDSLPDGPKLYILDTNFGQTEIELPEELFSSPESMSYLVNKYLPEQGKKFKRKKKEAFASLFIVGAQMKKVAVNKEGDEIKKSRAKDVMIFELQCVNGMTKFLPYEVKKKGQEVCEHGEINDVISLKELDIEGEKRVVDGSLGNLIENFI